MNMKKFSLNKNLKNEMKYFDYILKYEILIDHKIIIIKNLFKKKKKIIIIIIKFNKEN